MLCFVTFVLYYSRSLYIHVYIYIERRQDKDSLMDCHRVQEEPEGRPGGPGDLKTQVVGFKLVQQTPTLRFRRQFAGLSGVAQTVSIFPHPAHPKEVAGVKRRIDTGFPLMRGPSGPYKARLRSWAAQGGPRSQPAG